ncbi:hypothetical protein LAZ67_22001532 [Cordylochernes scorpioides]|uniref:Mos1 transposase HTH domain-containing protein n=1 Tax=Cordylochernes scorpioides TaxID=51811 RepID=A0ABY6LTA2_9ARAC|nr:hypothetical protein LAZ67_22001532 [Cordylochernes scorpioides]
MEQKLKQRICIEFCVKLQISATETFEMLNKAFPNDAPKRTTVFEWHSRFKAGRISIEDDPQNPRTTLLELEQDTGISKTTIGRIVTEDLKLKKTPAKFIPRFLTNEQKLCRLATCEDMMEMTRTDPEWKDKIITGDETWVYGYDPETKPQSAEWRGKRFEKKRPEKWTNGGWILHHDNARPHTAHLMTSFLAKNGTQILLQPPYFPDIAPNDFFLFPKLKAVLKGRHFDTRDDIIEKSPLALKSIPKEAYKNCFDNWEKRCGWIPHNENTLPFIPLDHTVHLKVDLGKPALHLLWRDGGKSWEILYNIYERKKYVQGSLVDMASARFLTNEQKLCRLATCEDMLEMTRTDPEWKDKIITGYETWVYGYDPETKHQSAEWRCQGELRPKKSRLLKSRNKVLLVAFLDKKGIFHHEYLPAGQKVIKDMYLGILRRLREAIRKKRPEKWTNGGWILHHDNARPHTAHLMTSFLAKKRDTNPTSTTLFPRHRTK